MAREQGAQTTDGFNIKLDKGITEEYQRFSRVIDDGVNSFLLSVFSCVGGMSPSGYIGAGEDGAAGTFRWQSMPGAAVIQHCVQQSKEKKRHK